MKEGLRDASKAIEFAETAGAYSYECTRTSLNRYLTLLRGFMEDNTFEVDIEGPGTLNQLSFILPAEEFSGEFKHLPIDEIRKIISPKKEVEITIFRTVVQVTSDTRYPFMIMIENRNIKLVTLGRPRGRTLFFEDHWTKRAKATVEFLGWIGDLLESKRVKPEAETASPASVTP